ncbi:acyl-CoA dehydrogenase family protein [Zavarzinia aquatilis]|uniref:Acyl-CoA dehydrogenase n=1 Tax=Zavarzinia aquatilis TaxID=2211142 RepID=A0A317EHS9_9PROT|nr:acyl-CoA dehydrogenase family protein [Zavarzinia aquatilis]PWR25884.1 acyl-CoA dehydrogenase [Zavarzinia aquatilis]
MTLAAARLHAPGPSGVPDFQPLFDEIERGAALRERQRILPFETVEQLKRAGFGALRNARVGQGGVDFRGLFRLVIALGAADANVAHIFRNHYTAAEQQARNPRNAVGRRLHEAVAQGALIGLGNGELGDRSVGGAGAQETLLVADGAGYRLNGRKYYTTGTLYSDYVLVRAATPAGEAASAVIPTKRAGVEVVDDWDGVGQRLTASGTTYFRDVAVSADEVVLDSTGIGYGLAYFNTQAQLFLTAVNAGIARAALTDAKRLLLGRGRNFYHAPVAEAAQDPALHQVIGQLAANAFAAEAVVLAAADELDAIALIRDDGREDAERAHRASFAAARAKIVVDELAIRNGSLLFEVGGASAATAGHNHDRHWRNARTLANHNPGIYKAIAVGAHELHGTPLPHLGFF